MLIGSSLARRVGWGVADQIVSSLSNFGLGILVARSVDPTDFGAFSLAFATYLIVMNLARPFAGEPLVIRFSNADRASWLVASRAAMAVSAGTGVMGSLICLAAAFATGGVLGGSFAALAPVLPGLLVQDTWRQAFFAGHRGRSAFMNDLIWLAVMVLLVWLLIASGRPSAPGFLLAWGIAGSIAAACGFVQARLNPRRPRIRRWISDHSDITRYLIVDRVVSTGATQATPFILTAISGLAAAGALRAGQLLMGPYTVAAQGARLAATPEASRMLARSSGRMRSGVRTFSVVMLAGVVAWFIVAWSIPQDVGQALLKSNWEPARSVLFPLFVWGGGYALAIGPDIGLTVLGAADRSLRLGVIISAVTIVGVTVGAVLDAAPGAVLGMAIGTWTAAVLGWRQLSLAISAYDAGTARVSSRPRFEAE